LQAEGALQADSIQIFGAGSAICPGSLLGGRSVVLAYTYSGEAADSPSPGSPAFWILRLRCLTRRWVVLSNSVLDQSLPGGDGPEGWHAERMKPKLDPSAGDRFI